MIVVYAKDVVDPLVGSELVPAALKLSLKTAIVLVQQADLPL
jgi:hypothetical protein